MTDLPVNLIPFRGSGAPANVSSSVGVPEFSNSTTVADRSLSIAALGVSDPETVRQEAERGDPSAIGQAKETLSGVEEVLLQQALAAQEGTLEELQAQILAARDKRISMTGTSDFYVEQGLGLADPEVSLTDMRYATNIQIAEQEFAAAFEHMGESGTLSTIGQFIDRYFIRAIPIGALEDISGRSENRGRDLLQAALSMDPDEYRRHIREYIQAARDEGVLTGDNIFALQEAFDEAINAGYDPMAGLNAAFGVLDLTPLGILAGKVVKSGARSLTQADSIITRTAAISGQETAGDIGERLVKTGDAPDAQVVTSMEPAMLDPGNAPVRPQSARMARIQEENTLWSSIRELDSGGAFGRAIPASKLKAVSDDLIKSYTNRVTNVVNGSHILTDLANNPILRLDLGKVSNGAAYKTERAAQKASDSSGIPHAKVSPVDPDNLGQGFVIRVEERINIDKGIDPLDITDSEFGFLRENLARLFGSNAALDDEYLTALANMGEAGSSAVRNLSKPFLKAMGKVNDTSKKAIVRSFKQLRDGIDADVKIGYTDNEFADVFRQQHPQGLSPTTRDLEAFRALSTFEDAAWIMRANEQLTRYVKDGFWSLETSQGRVVGKRVSSVPEEDAHLIMNMRTGLLVDVSDFEKTSVWRLDYPLEDGTKYIVHPSEVKVLDHADVLGFNSGGRRVNPDANYFVSFEGDVPRAFLTTFTEKQARLAVDELNNIGDAVKELGGDLRVLKSTDELDDLVARNNSWNPSIENFQDFLTLAISKNWDLSKRIAYKARDENLIVDGDDIRRGSSESYVRRQLSRSDDVLMDFGGGTAANIDPVSAILNDFKNAASHYTHRAYTFRAASSWVKRARQKGSGVKLDPSIPDNDYLRHIQHAEITGKHESARKLRHSRSILRRRLHMKGPVEERFNSFGQEASEFIFNTTGRKIRVSDPSNALLHIGFQSAFGFFNVSQFFMQGMHAFVNIAISPKQGLRAAGAVLPLRLAIHAPTKEIRDFALNGLAKFMGESKETMDELVDYIYTSGRDIVDGDAMELGVGPSYGVSGWGGQSMLPSTARTGLSKATSGGKRLLDAGLIPFRAGERLGRMTGITTAFFEFKSKFPKVSALSDEGRKWITTREQNLSFNMTASGRPLFQSGPMKVPTQWLSYTFRAMESVILGKGFSGAERARLAAALMPFYGLTGMGLGSAAEYFTEKFGVDDKETYIAMKYGVIDYLISEITPVETAVATRLAPITGFTDLWSKVVGGEATFLEVVGGPSGDIVSGLYQSFVGALDEVVNGHTVSLTEDALRILRQPSGIDNIGKGLGILNNGYYRSKTGNLLPVEMKPSDALIAFMGFSPFEVSEYYDRRSSSFYDAREFRAFRSEMLTDFRRALEIYSDNPDRGAEMLNEVSTKIALSPFSEQQQSELRRAMAGSSGDDVYRILMDLRRRGLNTSADLTEKTLGDSE